MCHFTNLSKNCRNSLRSISAFGASGRISLKYASSSGRLIYFSRSKNSTSSISDSKPREFLLSATVYRSYKKTSILPNRPMKRRRFPAFEGRGTNRTLSAVDIPGQGVERKILELPERWGSIPGTPFMFQQVMEHIFIRPSPIDVPFRQFLMTGGQAPKLLIRCC